MDYFCYISRTKVDQLYQNLTPELVDEWTEKRMTENDVGLEGTADFNLAKLVNLFKGGITYGRKGVIQREQKVKSHYVEKLRQVLTEITKEQPIPTIDRWLLGDNFSSVYYHVITAFRVATPIGTDCPSERVVSLSSEIGPRKLVLDCSLRFFSDGNQPDGTFQVNSLNNRFFSEGMPLTLESVFILLGQNDGEVIGSPLFLKLSPDHQVAL
jgi:hypothetical protein